MSGEKSGSNEKAANSKGEMIGAKPRIVPPAPAAVPKKEQDAVHQPGIIFSGLKEKLSSGELLKRME